MPYLPMVIGGYRPPFLINLWNFPDISLLLHQGPSEDRIANASCTASRFPENRCALFSG
jgi:hypothetical protein